jgi:hypothetical protein
MYILRCLLFGLLFTDMTRFWMSISVKYSVPLINTRYHYSYNNEVANNKEKMLYQGIFSYLPNITGCRYSMADIWHGKCQVITKVGVLTDGHRASAAVGQVVV